LSLPSSSGHSLKKRSTYISYSFYVAGQRVIQVDSLNTTDSHSRFHNLKATIQEKRRAVTWPSRCKRDRSSTNCQENSPDLGSFPPSAHSRISLNVHSSTATHLLCNRFSIELPHSSNMPTVGNLLYRRCAVPTSPTLPYNYLRRHRHARIERIPLVACRTSFTAPSSSTIGNLHMSLHRRCAVPTSPTLPHTSLRRHRRARIERVPLVACRTSFTTPSSSTLVVSGELEKFPLTISDFSEIRQPGLAYFDRTKYIPELQKMANVQLVCRPRRFRKSLTILMLRYFHGFQFRN
jgi:hypothetical protein